MYFGLQLLFLLSSMAASKSSMDDIAPIDIPVQIMAPQMPVLTSTINPSVLQEIEHPAITHEESVTDQNECLQAKNEKWTLQEECLLFELQAKMGNKWSKISEQLLQRSDNSVKNHFYSTLRKAARKFNKHLLDHKLKSQCRDLTNSMLYKIISVADLRFDTAPTVEPSLIRTSALVVEGLFKLVNDQYQNSQQLQQLLDEVAQFGSNYRKRKCKPNLKKQCLEERTNIQNEPQTIESPLLRKCSYRSNQSTFQLTEFAIQLASNKQIGSPTKSITAIHENVSTAGEMPRKQKRNLIVGGITRMNSIEDDQQIGKLMMIQPSTSMQQLLEPSVKQLHLLQMPSQYEVGRWMSISDFINSN